MSWLTWRQHRLEAFATLGVLALIAVVLVLRALAESATYQNVVLPCFSASLQVYELHGCQGAVRDFAANYALGSMFGYLNLLPALAGMFIGAPLIAREIERGTHRFAWAQGITRLRWIGVKIAWTVAGLAVASAAAAILVTWFRQPVDLVQGHLVSEAYDFEGPVLVAYAVFALGLGSLAGIVIRRIVPAMAVTLGLFLAVRLPVEFLRGHVIPPVTHAASVLSTYQTPPGAWVLDSGYQDSAGRHLSDVQLNHIFDLAQATGGNKSAVRDYLAAHHIDSYWVFQPADRFWTFQAIETAVFLLLALAAFAAAVVLLRRLSA